MCITGAWELLNGIDSSYILKVIGFSILFVLFPTDLRLEGMSLVFFWIKWLIVSVVGNTLKKLFLTNNTHIWSKSFIYISYNQGEFRKNTTYTYFCNMLLFVFSDVSRKLVDCNAAAAEWSFLLSPSNTEKIRRFSYGHLLATWLPGIWP